MKSLAVLYRPTSFEEVVEQDTIKEILLYQIKTNTIKNAYLFTGGAGTGKTTCARIFANEINKGIGNPIEIDAASNSGVDDVREIIKQAQTKSLEAQYKCFIVDECHSISDKGWQAFLKLLEEPPANTIFIFCTTNPEKIPKTILSRVQRYDFKRISYEAIVERLVDILGNEIDSKVNKKQIQAIEYISKVADGGMRDAITMLDKVMSYTESIDIDAVVSVLGVTDYSVMFELTNAMLEEDAEKVIEIIEKVHYNGNDLKLFVKDYLKFLLDLQKYNLTESFDYVTIPQTSDNIAEIESYDEDCFSYLNELLGIIIQLNSDIKWDSSPKVVIESTLIQECMR